MLKGRRPGLTRHRPARQSDRPEGRDLYAVVVVVVVVAVAAVAVAAAAAANKAVGHAASVVGTVEDVVVETAA